MNQTTGQLIAQKMATSKPLTKWQMLRKWPSLGSIQEINSGIDWIEAVTTNSDNPFLFFPVNGEAKWAFRDNWPEVALNLGFNLRYLTTRMTTFQRVLDQAIASPVVKMTPSEKRAAKAVAAQAGGTIAFLQSMAGALPR